MPASYVYGNANESSPEMGLPCLNENDMWSIGLLVVLLNGKNRVEKDKEQVVSDSS